MASEKCPPFGAGSVDFNHVNAAARQGHNLDKAIAEATTRPGDKGAKPDETVPAPSETIAAPVTAEAAEAAAQDAAEAESASAPKRTSK